MTIIQLTQTQADKLNLNQLNRLVYQLAGFEVNHSLKSLKRFLSQPNLYQVGAFIDDNLVGLASLFIIEKIEYSVGSIEGVVVDEAYRQQGIGRAMMASLIDKARKLKLVHLDLTSHPTRVAANQFYRKCGFKQRQTNVYRLLVDN